MKEILILNGPNLNLLGFREPEIYGTTTLDDLEKGIREHWPEVEFIFSQSNNEGELIDRLHHYGLGDFAVDGIVFNPGAYTHTSLALADAIRAIKAPVVEVHLSNTAAREQIRRTSLTAPACIGSVAGFGTLSYYLAIEALLKR